MQRHLNPTGLIVFETRNPALDWQNKWNYDIEIELPSGGSLNESRRFISMEDNKLTFELRYQFATELLTSKSTLRFWTEPEIVQKLEKAKLRVEKIIGDWNEDLYKPSESEEMIFFVRHSI
jgi:hypothetical protein